MTTEEDKPNVTKSEKESNCVPKEEFTLNNLAKKPSKKSHIQPNKTQIDNVFKSPLIP